MENVSVYADYSNINFNIYNFSLLFGSIEEGRVVTMGKIKMSPEAAKALVDLLQTNIEAYETTYGPINVFDEKAREREQILAETLKAKKEESKPKEEVSQTIEVEPEEVVQQKLNR